jgi:hypothetical protein
VPRATATTATFHKFAGLHQQRNLKFYDLVLSTLALWTCTCLTPQDSVNVRLWITSLSIDLGNPGQCASGDSNSLITTATFHKFTHVHYYPIYTMGNAQSSNIFPIPTPIQTEFNDKDDFADMSDLLSAFHLVTPLSRDGSLTLKHVSSRESYANSNPQDTTSSHHSFPVRTRV